MKLLGRIASGLGRDTSKGNGGRRVQYRQRFRAGRFHGSIKHEMGRASDSDQNWIPAPFPEHNLLITFCFACEG